MSSIVVLRKIGGFYTCFDNDAIIISYLCNYKIVNNRVGFPINTINKVSNWLDNNSISYIIKNDDNEDKKIYGKKNKYNYYLDKGKKKINIDYRVNDIIKKINDMKEEDIVSLLDLIEDRINEWFYDC